MITVKITLTPVSGQGTAETDVKTIETYAEFWPYYLREHARPATRAWHYVGTSAAIALLIYTIVSKNWFWLPAALVCGYAFAWVSHGFIEKNKPATFTYPFWSLISDFRMLFCGLTGQIDKELKKAGAMSDSIVE